MNIPETCPFCLDNLYSSIPSEKLWYKGCLDCQNFHLKIMGDKICYFSIKINEFGIYAAKYVDKELTIISKHNKNIIGLSQFLLPNSFSICDLNQFMDRLLNLNIYS